MKKLLIITVLLVTITAAAVAATKDGSSWPLVQFAQQEIVNFLGESQLFNLLFGELISQNAAVDVWKPEPTDALNPAFVVGTVGKWQALTPANALNSLYIEVDTTGKILRAIIVSKPAGGR